MRSFARSDHGDGIGRRLVLVVATLGMLLLTLAPAARASGGPAPSPAGPRSASFTLDGVRIVLTLAPGDAPPAPFVAAPAGDASQVAGSTAWRPFREISITAVPFGTWPGTESVPVAGGGGAPVTLAALRVDRLRQGGHPFAISPIELFGHPAPVRPAWSAPTSTAG